MTPMTPSRGRTLVLLGWDQADLLGLKVKPCHFLLHPSMSSRIEESTCQKNMAGKIGFVISWLLPQELR